jgi:SAM-dependent methyltransferase
LLNGSKTRVLVPTLKAGLFRLSRGHYSNHRWYGHYKELELKRTLQSAFTSQQLPSGYGRWLDERLVEYPWMLSRLPEAAGDLLDAGSTLNHSLILEQPRLRNKRITVLTLAPEAQCFWRQGISYVFGDVRQTYFRDSSFDHVVCVSVLEHIGLDNRMYDPDRRTAERDPEAYLAAVAEFRRVLRPDGTCLITVPFGRYQLRNWLQVFDSVMMERILNVFQPSKHNIEYYRYTQEEQWQRCSQDEAADAPYFDLNSDLPWPKCPAGAGAIACLELKK